MVRCRSKAAGRVCGGSILGPVPCFPLWALLAACFGGAAGDITFHDFSPTAQGHAQSEREHLRFVNSAEVGFFSSEFDEYCPEVGSSAAFPAPTSQRFEHPLLREDPNRSTLPLNSYMDDGVLDNPWSHRVVDGVFTEYVDTIDHVPDGDLLPLPHDRTQMCHYAMRLTRTGEKNQLNAAWSRFKQRISYGFETQFHFRVLHRNQSFVAQDLPSPWGFDEGSDGFAFVVQNDDRAAIGKQMGAMGYNIPTSIAVEFDMSRGEAFGDFSPNHVSVHAPQYRGLSNSPLHSEAEIAYSDDIPLLQEGTHEVRIRYDPRAYSWDSLSSAYESDIEGTVLKDHHAGNPGLLTIFIDGFRAIAVPVDLQRVVFPDGTSSVQANPPVPPNTSAFDEGGAGPGRAYVGFTAGTSAENWQAVDILSWTFTEFPGCPGEETDEMICREEAGVANRSDQCSADGNYFCTLLVQNAARTDLLFSAKTKYDKDYEVKPCSNSILQWDGMHPYFLGCARTLKFNHNMRELWVSSLDGSRSMRIWEPHILQQDPALNGERMGFKRASPFRFCIAEHPGNVHGLQLAECNCDYCVRVTELQASYQVFYQDRCNTRYGDNCPCFEVSEMSHDQSAWVSLEPMKYMRLGVCRGCAYHSQCNRMLTVGLCREAYQTYTIGNPTAPTILDNGFEDMLRDGGRVEDGRLRGDSCDCEPNMRPYIGDPEGRRGMCNPAAEMAREYGGTVEHCLLMCEAEKHYCFYFTLMADGTCITYSNCFWELCATETCFTALTYQMADLGLYTDTAGSPQLFPVYPKRTIQTTPDRCFDCLHLYIDEYCTAECGPAKYVTYSHHPGGQSCATCMFAGNRMHELLATEVHAVKTCVYEATTRAEDPWIVCDDLVRSIADVSAPDLFNGVSTHFLSTCPSRPLDDMGAVCVPNIAARHHFPSQLIDRPSALNNTVWHNELECMNALCQLVPKWTCYARLTVFPYERHTHGVLNDTVNVLTTPYNGPMVRNDALELTMGAEQYVVTEPLPFELTNITLEAWVTLSEEYNVTDLAPFKYITASTNWREDYEPWYMTDGDLWTYWSSHTGQLGQVAFEVQVLIDLNFTNFAGEVHIYWKEPAADFEIWTSLDNVTWWLLLQVTDNDQETTKLQYYFQARYVKLIMTKVARLRPQAQVGAGLPVYSIREFEVLTDVNEARLKPTWVTHTWNWTEGMGGDGDLTTFWSTQPHTEAAEYLIDLGEDIQAIVTLRFFWRYKPFKFILWLGPTPCDGMPAEKLEVFVASQVTQEIVLILPDSRPGGCIGVEVVETAEAYGIRMVAINELEAYAEYQNTAPASGVLDVWPPVDPAFHLTPVQSCLDNNLATYWWFEVPTATILKLDLGSVKRIVAIEVVWADVETSPGIITPYQPTHWQLTASESLYGEVFVIDSVLDSLDRRRKITLFELCRWVQLEITTVADVGDGRCAISEFIVTEATHNLIDRPATTFNASSEWIPYYLTQPGMWCSNWMSSQLHLPSMETSVTQCGRRCLREPGCVSFSYQQATATCTGTFGVAVGQCYLWNESCDGISDPCWDNYEVADTGHTSVNGSERVHAPEHAVDGDLISWWGGALGYDPFVIPYLEVTIVGQPVECDFAIIRWKYPAEQVNVYIRSYGGQDYNKAGGELFNTEYVTPIVFTGVYFASAARVTVGDPLEQLAGMSIVGIREFELFDTSEDNYLLNTPAERCSSTDGSEDVHLAVDDTSGSKWSSTNQLPVNITFDLGQVISAWGTKLIMPSAQIAQNYAIMQSLDNETWTLVDERLDNTEYTIYSVQPFHGRYIMLAFRQLAAAQYGVRSFVLFGCQNLLLNRYAFASSDWNHSGFEAVDGINDTFFVSEPLAMASTIRVDLLKQTYIIDGIRIRWRFPAQEFEVWVGDEYNYTREITNESGTFEVLFWSQSWDMLHHATDNFDNYTVIDTDFEARYVELRMYVPDATNGDWSYAIYDFDVMFDPNLAHGKVITAERTINNSYFVETNVNDRDWESYWMPAMGTDDGRIVIDFGVDTIISGYELWWRRSPVTYQTQNYNESAFHNGFSWYTVQEYTAITPLPYASLHEERDWGFVSRYFAIQCVEVLDGDEGKVAALREMEFTIPDLSTNYLLAAPVEVSQEDILGNQKYFITDGTDTGTYWLPDYGVREAWFRVHLPVDPDDELDNIIIGRAKIWYRFPPGKVRVEGWYEEVAGWEVLGEAETNACWIFDQGPVCAEDDFYFTKRARMFQVYIDSTIPDTDIGVLEIRAWGVQKLIPPKVLPAADWISEASYMIDYDLQSYWMGPPYRSDGVSNIDPLQADHITINLDIGQVYDAANIKVWFGFKPQMYDLFISVDGTNWEQREVTSGRTWGLIFLAQTENPIPVRYVRLYIIKAFRDEADPAQWGTSIRDFEVYRWRNLARNRTAEADSVWDYPVHRANDNDPDTAWVGRFGAPEAEVVLDLGEVKNIAGFHVSMGYIVSNVRFSSSYDGIQYTSRYVWQNMGMDDPKELGIDSSIHHFQCRYVKIHMWVPIDDQKHPDYYYDEELEEPMMSINEIQLLEHPGGGGIFGIQNLDGSQYSTLSFGLRQPGEYILASEQDLYTQDLGGGKPGDEGQLVHLVVSFAQTHTDAGTPDDVRRTMISVYRNGVYHGSRYEVDGPMSRLNQPNQTRLVFGIRSTTFTDASVADPGAGVVHGSTHSPFFGGKIHNATLFSNALAQDEVRGIYLAASGRGNESACQCYDACPMGENRHFPGVPVPCSGQGACVAGSAITGFVTGTCVCLQGFSGAACENHCSDLSKWGCCKVDDDCPSHLQCYTGVGACSCSISLNDCPEDRDCDVGGTNLCTLMKAT